AAPPAGEAQIPVRVRQLIAAHCVGCHDQHHSSLNLATLPSPAEPEVWSSMLERLQSQTMPPRTQRTVAGRFPLDPALRSQLVSGIEEILGTAADRAPRPRFLSPRAWRAIVASAFASAVGERR